MNNTTPKIALETLELDELAQMLEENLEDPDQRSIMKELIARARTDRAAVEVLLDAVEAEHVNWNLVGSETTWAHVRLIPAPLTLFTTYEEWHKQSTCVHPEWWQLPSYPDKETVLTWKLDQWEDWPIDYALGGQAVHNAGWLVFETLRRLGGGKINLGGLIRASYHPEWFVRHFADQILRQGVPIPLPVVAHLTGIVREYVENPENQRDACVFLSLASTLGILAHSFQQDHVLKDVMDSDTGKPDGSVMREFEEAAQAIRDVLEYGDEDFREWTLEAWHEGRSFMLF